MMIEVVIIELCIEALRRGLVTPEICPRRFGEEGRQR